MQPADTAQHCAGTVRAVVSCREVSVCIDHRLVRCLSVRKLAERGVRNGTTHRGLRERGVARCHELADRDRTCRRAHYCRNTDDGSDPLGNDDATQFDQDFVGGRAEWSRDLDGQREIAVGADLGYLQLDGEHYYSYLGADAEWREQATAETRVLLTFGLRDMQFENDIYDNLMSRVRGGVRHRLNNAWMLNGDIAVEYEAQKNQRPGGDAVRAILSGSASWLFVPNQRLTGDLSYARTEYSTEYGAPFNDIRTDDRIVVGVQWDKTIRRLWQVKARAQYRDQDSTLSTYTFDQTSGSVSLTRYF